VLFHTYHFPPIGGSGAQRPLKMVRALVGLGYDLVVVTRGLEERTERWAPEDATLVDEIPAELDVRRLPGSDEPSPSGRWRPVAERWLGLKDPWTAWWTDSSYELGLEASGESDLIYVWMQPYASAEAGARLSKALGKPWVADLGDPWALDEMMIFPSGLHRRMALRKMRQLLGTASAIVMSTPEAARRLLREFPEFERRPVVSIPNGFDPDDFIGPVEKRRDGKFRLVHTGYLHTELGLYHRRRRLLTKALGGSAPDVDILTRSHVHVVEAINRLLLRDPDLRGIVEFHLAGVMSNADRQVAARCPVVQVHEYMSHADSIELMRTADLLFLPMQNLPPGARATVVPGKTYEYLASGTPILAAVPDGDARDILGAAGNAILVRPDDVESITAGIHVAFERSRAGITPQGPDPELVAHFEYGTLAMELHRVFQGVLGARSRAASSGPR
jgi:glycosyltransferase involved in cell wall biosynthesis